MLYVNKESLLKLNFSKTYYKTLNFNRLRTIYKYMRINDLLALKKIYICEAKENNSRHITLINYKLLLIYLIYFFTSLTFKIVNVLA